jgi:hypothetical protein
MKSIKETTTIPKEVQKEVLKIVKEFNDEELDLINEFYKYVARFKGNYVYLMTKKYNKVMPSARLAYSGVMNKWQFEIYKYSSEHYDKNERFFPGSEYIDGTIKGALNACITAYPPM